MTLVALKARRLTVGLSQEALARRAGCSLSMVRVVEGGYRASDDLATRLAHALDCEPEDLSPADPLVAAAAA